MEDLRNRTHFSCIKTEEDARLPVPVPLSPLEFPQPRASLRYLGRTTTSLSYRLEGLSQAANKYVKFDMAVTKVSTGQQVYYNAWTSSNTTNSTDHTATGLQPATEYYVVCEAYTNAWYPVGTATNWTEAPADTTAPSCTVKCDTSGYIQASTFKAWVSASDSGSGVMKVWFGLCYVGGGAIQQYTWGADGGGVIGNGDYIYNFNTPGYGTYELQATVKDKSGNTRSHSKQITIGRDNTPPTITSRWVEQQGDKIIGFMRATDSQSGVGGCYYYISAPNNKDVLSSPIYKSGANTSHSFTTDAYGNPFQNGSRYWISMGVHDKTVDNANFRWTLDPESGYPFEKPRPQDWSWSSTARLAFTGTGSERLTSNLTVVEWNNFVDRVIDFSEWNSTGSSNLVVYGLTLSQCKLYIPGNDTLKAGVFNRVRYAVGSLTSTGISDKAKGDAVMGSYFITFENCIKQATYSAGEREAYEIENPLTLEEKGEMYNELFGSIE